VSFIWEFFLIEKSSFSEIDDQDIKQLMKNLENLSSLKKLALYFDKSLFIIEGNFYLFRLPKLTEEGVETISQSLKRMGSLQIVKLGFFEFDFFVSVKRLIPFCRCTRVDKQSVDILVQNLKELPFKICCSLNFYDFFRLYKPFR